MMMTGIQIHLQVLNDLMAIASATKSATDILNEALDIVLEAFGEDMGCAFLVEGEALRLAAHRGLPTERARALERSAAQRTAVDAVTRKSHATSMGELGAGATPLEPIFLSQEAQVILKLPLVAHDRLLGSLWIGTLQDIQLDPTEGEFLDTIGRVIGLALDSLRLYTRMEQRLRASEALYRVSQALVSTLDLDQLLNLIVHSAVRTIEKANNAVLHLLDEQTGELHPRALSFESTPPNPRGRSRMRVGQGIAGYALESGSVVNVPDVACDPRFVRVGEVRPFAAMMVAPLKLGERVVGTLSVDSHEAHAFSLDDEQMLMTLATQATAAIQNARLVHDLQQSLQDLKSTQEQLIQSEKLSAIGQLIAGVAHELNNPLTAVMGYAQLLQTGDALPEGVQHDVEKIYFQAHRAARIVQNLLTFARQHKAERQFVDVNEVLQRTLELRAYQLRVENIEVTTRLGDRVLGTMADPNQLQQVFLNLINNAQDAMTEHRGGGHLVVQTGLRDGYIGVSFADNGPGLSPEAQKHLFEPFFTTKEVGKGTGLGLSICFGIISQHEGRIWAESKPGQGATFMVELPAIAEDLVSAEESDPQLVALPRSKLILIVEDEEDVAALLERVLLQDGHRVVVAQDGKTALKHLADARKRQARFDLVISDVKMPGLGGPALYQHLRQQDPALGERVVFITGDTLSPGTHGFLQRVRRPYLSKPFTINDLRRIMTEVLATQ